MIYFAESPHGEFVLAGGFSRCVIMSSIADGAMYLRCPPSPPNGGELPPLVSVEWVDTCFVAKTECGHVIHSPEGVNWFYGAPEPCDGRYDRKLPTTQN
jgi:hypothetical protein